MGSVTAKDDSDKIGDLQRDVTAVKTTLDEGVKPTIARLEKQSDRILERLDQMAFTPLADHQALSNRVKTLEDWRIEMKPMKRFWDMVTGNLAKVFSVVVVSVLLMGSVLYVANNFPNIFKG
jgi:hypothetical protein